MKRRGRGRGKEGKPLETEAAPGDWLILDAHTHIFPEEICRCREDYFADEPAFRLLYDSPQGRMLQAAELVEALEAEGLKGAVVLGFPWRQERLWRRHNEVILAAMRRWPRFLRGFCAVHPLEPGAVREAERCLAAGFRGVGEIAWYLEDPGTDLLAVLAPIAEVCQHYRAPLLLHTNDPLGPPYRGKAAISLAGIYEAIKAFPEVTWILGHWGGGLPFYGLVKKEVPDTFRNVYFDTAASPYLYRPQIYRLAAEMVGPEKILYGSDYPLIPPRRYLAEMEAADLPEEWKALILGKNLANLLDF
jgi:predicted TIM-barrel fold metal-dependent hydrolase